ALGCTSATTLFDRGPDHHPSYRFRVVKHRLEHLAERSRIGKSDQVSVGAGGDLSQFTRKTDRPRGTPRDHVDNLRRGKMRKVAAQMAHFLEEVERGIAGETVGAETHGDSDRPKALQIKRGPSEIVVTFRTMDNGDVF